VLSNRKEARNPLLHIAANVSVNLKLNNNYEHFQKTIR